MLAELVREFCNAPENDYRVYENYVKRCVEMSGEITVTTIGIVAKGDCSAFEVVEQMANYLLAKEGDGPLLDAFWDEVEGFQVDAFGEDIILYFPAIQDYHPVQP